MGKSINWNYTPYKPFFFETGDIYVCRVAPGKDYIHFEWLDAKENEYDAFSTTLLVSPYQNHEALKELGEKLAEEYGIEFVYRDFRIGFREGQTKARELELYMQKYCGCVFSEEERYDKQIKRDKQVL